MDHTLMHKNSGFRFERASKIEGNHSDYFTSFVIRDDGQKMADVYGDTKEEAEINAAIVTQSFRSQITTDAMEEKKDIQKEFDALSPEKKIEVLYNALGFMSSSNSQTELSTVAKAMGITNYSHDADFSAI
jgi:ribosomal protein L25 (general stress protein Ctc)